MLVHNNAALAGRSEPRASGDVTQRQAGPETARNKARRTVVDFRTVEQTVVNTDSADRSG